MVRISTALYACILCLPLIGSPPVKDPVENLPGPVEDTESFNGQTASEFFANRRSDKKCRADLDRLREEYVESKKQLAVLVAERQQLAQEHNAELTDSDRADVDSAEDLVRKKTQEIVEQIDRCGDCFARPVAKQELVNPAGEEQWYFADGSCLVAASTEEKATRGYLAAVDLLTSPGHYPAKRGGFHNIVDLKVYDAKTFEPLPEFNSDIDRRVSASPGSYAVWVRGPELPWASTAYWYLTINELTYPKPERGDDGFYFVFQTPEVLAKKDSIDSGVLAAARAFKAPAVADVSALGLDKKTIAFPLPRVFGSWYVKRSGDEIYMRYSTGADVGRLQPFLDKQGRRILLESMLEISERVRAAVNAG